VRVVDGTTAQQPGAKGTSLRVHFSLRLPTLEADFIEVTDAHQSESLKRLPIQSGDIVLGDRAYGEREGVAHVVEQGGAVVVRLTRTTFPLLNAEGRPFQLMAALRSLPDEKPAEWPVEFEVGKKRYKARLCAIRHSDDTAERARKRLRKKRAKKGKRKKLHPTTVEAAGYIFVLTTLTKQEASAQQVLDLYRARWQVELAFKRLKSLLHAGHLLKRTMASARAWLQAKLLTAVLIERLMQAARFFFLHP
jgi:SRSO17 transposase